MSFIPPMQLPDPPKIDADALKKIDPNDSHILKYSQKYKDSEKQASQKMAEEIAAQKHKKKTDFLFDVFKAIIVALVTLVIEHSADIIQFVANLFRHLQ